MEIRKKVYILLLQASSVQWGSLLMCHPKRVCKSNICMLIAGLYGERRSREQKIHLSEI